MFPFQGQLIIHIAQSGAKVERPFSLSSILPERRWDSPGGSPCITCEQDTLCLYVVKRAVRYKRLDFIPILRFGLTEVNLLSEVARRRRLKSSPRSFRTSTNKGELVGKEFEAWDS